MASTPIQAMNVINNITSKQVDKIINTFNTKLEDPSWVSSNVKLVDGIGYKWQVVLHDDNPVSQLVKARIIEQLEKAGWRVVLFEVKDGEHYTRTQIIIEVEAKDA